MLHEVEVILKATVAWMMNVFLYVALSSRHVSHSSNFYTRFFKSVCSSVSHACLWF